MNQKKWLNFLDGMAFKKCALFSKIHLKTAYYYLVHFLPCVVQNQRKTIYIYK